MTTATPPAHRMTPVSFAPADDRCSWSSCDRTAQMMIGALWLYPPEGQR